MKPDKRPKKPNNRAIKKIRDKQIIAEAVTGATGRELSKKYGIGHDQVSKILNGPEATALVKRGESEMSALIDQSVKVMKNCLFSPDERIALDAAKTILKSTGVLKEKVDHTHRLVRPVIIKRRNGDEVILTSEEVE